MDKAAHAKHCTEMNSHGIKNYCNHVYSSQSQKTQTCEERFNNICQTQVAVHTLQQDMIRFTHCAAQCSSHDSMCFQKCQGTPVTRW